MLIRQTIRHTLEDYVYLALQKKRVDTRHGTLGCSVIHTEYLCTILLQYHLHKVFTLSIKNLRVQH